MSDASPQKGWDSWFGPQPGSSGGEQNAPEQQQAPREQAQQNQEAGETPVVAPEQVSAAPPETEAEQTNWTVPVLRAVQEGGGDDAQATQIATPKPAAAVPNPRRYSAPSGAGQGLSQGQGQGQSQSRETPGQSQIPAQGSEQAPTQVQAQTQTQRPAQGSGGDAAQGPAAGQAPSPTQSSQGSAQSPATGSAPDPDQIATQYAPQGLGQNPDQVATHYSPQIPAQPRTGASAASAATQAAPEVLAWQAPQPAQMWSAAPGSGGYARQQGAGQQPAQPPQPPQGPGGEDEWAGWDEPDRRRPAPFLAQGAAGGAGDGARPGSRRKLAVASGVGVAGIIGLATVLLLNQASSGGGGAGAKPSGFQPTATTVAGDAQETAAAFLAAWQSGDFQQAANLTDAPASALSTLTAYHSDLHLAGLQLTAQSATADSPSAAASATASSSGAPAVTESGSVSFGVAAKVGIPASPASSASGSSASGSSSAGSSPSSASGSSSGTAMASDVTANWSYTSKLTAYKKGGGWWIKWDPALVAPNLTAGQKVVSLAIPPTASEVADAAGGDLSSATDPGVRNIAAALKKAAPTGQGTPGVEVELEGADGKPVASTADVLQQPVATGVVKTTINPTVEAAAQTAVRTYPNSSMVVLKPSTGEILAVANNDGQNDFALTARVAPGSTNKIVTATALLAGNLITSPSQAVECPKTITVNGTVFANSQNESEPAGTPFLDDFAASCNNAFGQWYDKIGPSTLAQTAQKYYGLDEQWNLGLGAAGPYYTIPSSSSNGELFQELFGQGQLETAPLAMASIAATVDSGTFKQPIVVPGAAQVAATPLPTNVQQDLWQLMKAVTTQSNGTAYGVFTGVNSQVYGKTGTADVGDGSAKQQKPNSWMVVFDPTLDLAVGCVVLNAGYGASFAGPETAAVLKALQ